MTGDATVYASVIQIEYETTERLTDHKSLVDMKLAMGTSREYYKNGIGAHQHLRRYVRKQINAAKRRTQKVAPSLGARPFAAITPQPSA